MKYALGVIGAGNMAEAIVRGVIGAGLFDAGRIIAADINPQRRELFERDLKVRAVEQSPDAARDAEVVLLSVKPQHMADALAGMGDVMSEATLVISIAAGISTKYIETHLGRNAKWRVVRAMPNTPMLVGEGVVAIATGSRATPADLEQARRIFSAAAQVIDAREDQIDAVTAVSGSGPAYFFYLVEQMIRAGVELGLSPEQAKILATRTASGAAKMLTQTGESPQELRRKVTSPAGTTHAAISHMDAKQWPQITVDALKAAARRGQDLSSGG
jgi:pyrroline-5-carboxylate reductase